MNRCGNLRFRLSKTKSIRPWPLPLCSLGDWPEENWWTLYQDDTLEALIYAGLENNPRIKLADAQARLSQAEANITRSVLLPQVFVAGDVTRYRASKTGIFGVIPQEAAVFPFSYTQPEFSLNFTFEIDWWGKNRNALKAALGQVQADIAEAAEARLILSISIAQAYFQLQTPLAREALANRLAANNNETLQLIQQRLANHLDSGIQIQQQEQNVSVAQEYFLSLRQEVATRRNTIHALVAGQWDEIIPPIPLEQATYAPLSLPADLPLDLVYHRPEIIAQLWLIDAAANQTAVARKEFYPNINLMGLIGQQTLIDNTLFRDHSKYGQIGPAIHLPLFERGTAHRQPRRRRRRVCHRHFAIRKFADPGCPGCSTKFNRRAKLELAPARKCQAAGICASELRFGTGIACATI